MVLSHSALVGARGVAQRLVQAVGRRCTVSFHPPNIQPRLFNRAAWRQLRFSHDDTLEPVRISPFGPHFLLLMECKYSVTQTASG